MSHDFYQEVAAEIEEGRKPIPNVSPDLHVKMVTIPVSEINPERAVALRGEMIQLAHSGEASSPEAVVARADAYFEYIINGVKSK